MPALPISTVRTSSSLSTFRLISQLNADQVDLQKQFDQLSTGRRVQSFSDDPVAAGRALGLQRGINRGNQLLRNANSTAGFYAATDSALGRVDNALIEARATAVEAAQNVISDDQRAALATTIRETINSVFAAGNTLFRDHQMLGGILNPGDALHFEGNEIVYSGTNAVGRTELGAGFPTQINMAGNEALGIYSIVVEGEPLNAALDPNTRLVDMRRGEGVEAGVIRVSGGGDWIDIDLQGAATIGDVADVISSMELEGRQLSTTITDDGFRVEYADGLPGTLAIDDAEGSTMALDLGINNSGGVPTSPVIGDRLAPRVTPLTKIDDLDDGNGLDLSSGIRIAQGDQVFDINLDDAETLSDVLIAINRSDADVHAELNEAEGRILIRAGRSGVDYSIGENGGLAATNLGIRSATASTFLSDLGRGRGITTNPGATDLIVTRTDGVELEIDLDGASSIQDVIDLIETHPLNTGTKQVLVDLNDVGNGIQIKAPPDVGPLSIRQVGASDAGVRLGLIPPGTNENTGELLGAVDTIIGTDYALRDAGGAIDTLLRLEDAILDGDVLEIGRLQAKLNVDLDTASRSRGKVGVWSRNLDQLKTATEDSVIQMQSQLSEEVDADFAQVVSDLQQRQLAIEASMRLIGQTAQQTVLNYL